MMFLFRSTFIATTVAFIFAVSLFSVAVTASPQYGRPMFHAMDKITSDGPVTYTYEGGAVQVVTPSTIVAAAATSPPTPSPSTNSAGPLRHMSGGKVALGVAAAFVYIVLS